MNTLIAAIPNENIFKFITVLGLIIFFSPSILDQKQLNNEIEYIECKKNIEIIKWKLDEVEKDLKMYNNDILLEMSKIKDQLPIIELIVDEAENYFNKNANYKYKILKFSMSMREVENIINDIIVEQVKKMKETSDKYETINQLLKENDIKNKETSLLIIENEYEIEKLEVKYKYLIKAKVIDYISRIIGLFLFLFGFIFWYKSIMNTNSKLKRRIRIRKRI